MKKRKLLCLLCCILFCLPSCEKSNLKDIEPEVIQTANTGSETNIKKDPVSETPDLNLEEKTMKFEFLYDEEYWEQYDLSYAQFQTKEEYEKAVLNAMDAIATLYHKEGWYKQYADNKDTIYIRLTIEDSIYEGVSIPPTDYTMNSLIMRLQFTPNMFTHRSSPFAHELTHIITRNKSTGKSSFSLSLTEGICEYASNMVEGSECTNQGIDIQTFYKYYFKTAIEHNFLTQEKVNTILACVGTEGNAYPDFFPDNGGGAWILASYSFVDYLIQTYGMDAMMTIFSADDETIYYDYNPDGLAGLKADWQDFLENYVPVMSDEEINDYVTELNIHNGYTAEMESDLYTGEYSAYDINEPMLEIQKNNDGTYKIQIGIYRLIQLDDCTGLATAEGLSFSTTELGDRNISGIITLDDDIATVTFTGSGWSDYSSVMKYKYYKTSDTPDIK
ncbi:MAG: hypothetical protein E7256_12490 [Lachnospiraceae bacterium]|nr:hypothetical protein [Lachnospiraceae bacterium]